jgi:ankyrin repeat protein
MDWSHAHEAVEQEDLTSLVEILDSGADVDDPDWDGATLLHHAIDVEVGGAAQTGQPLRAELTRLLVSRGSNLGWRWRGQTPLETALARGHYLAVDAIRAATRKDSR